MNQKILLFLSIFIISTFADSERIAGGGIANLGDFPYHVKIEPSIGSFRQLCGGALIRYNWVITVAQCIFNVRDVIVRLGVIDRLSGPEGAIFWVRERTDIIVHDDYRGDSVNAEFSNDIGLIYLREATEDIIGTMINNTIVINTVALPPSNDLNLDNNNIFGVATGFGFYEDGDQALQSMKLRFVAMMTIPLQTCRNFHGTTRVTGGNFCTDTTGGHSTCIGDEGGPFVASINGILTVVGLASTTFPQCTVGHPAIFTNLVSHYDWIMDNIDQAPVTDEPPSTPPDNGNNCNCICNCYTCPAKEEPIIPFDDEPKTNNFWDE